MQNQLLNTERKGCFLVQNNLTRIFPKCISLIAITNHTKSEKSLIFFPMPSFASHTKIVMLVCVWYL